MRERSKTHQSQLFPSRSLVDISIVPRHLSACLLIFFPPLGEKQRWVLENEAVCCHKRCRTHVRAACLLAACCGLTPAFGSGFQTEKYHQRNSGSSLLCRLGRHHHDTQRDWFLGCSQTPRCLTNTYRVCTKVQVTCPLVTAMCTSIRTGLKMSSPRPGWWDMRVD